MRGLEFCDFSPEHLAPASRLLAARHARQRAVEPLVAEDADFEALVAGEVAAEGASGVVAVRADEVVGFVIGRVQDEPTGGGTAAVVELPGHAAEEPEIVRDLYATLAQRWVDGGVAAHVAFVPATDDGLTDAWFRLGFGAQAVYAARETTPNTAADAASPEIEIRLGTREDLERVVALDRALWEHQQRSPSFSGRALPSDDEFRDAWKDTWDDEDFTQFVATLDGRVAGHVLLFRGRRPSLRIPPGSVDLADAGTLPELRGRGIGVALTAHALAWAHAAGYRAMTIDWRITNLLASRFWPRRGFRPTFYRLYRSVP
jgi:ribosomal protein S18 acetylase RimI-like enzyme